MQEPLPRLDGSPKASAASNPYVPRSDYGRPLDMLLAGATLSLGTMAGIIAIAYKTWYLDEIGENTAILIIGLLFFVYTGGVWLFSYAWERGDPAKAIRLTAVIVVLSAVAVLVAALVMTMLAKSRGALSGGEGEEATSGGGEGRRLLGMRLGPVLRTAGSYVEDGHLDGAADETPSELSTVRCEKCGERFIPLPPKALCPFCGWAAVTTAA